MPHRFSFRFPAAVLLLPLLVASAARAEEGAYFDVTFDHLTVTEGKFPKQGDALVDPLGRSRAAYAVLDGPGSAYAAQVAALGESHLVIHTPDRHDITGRLYLENDDASAMVLVKFSVPAAEATPKAHDAFYKAMASHYDSLLAQGIPGAAWFRHQARKAGKALGSKEDNTVPAPGVRPESLDDTFSLFTGNEALAENLQLEKALPPGAAKPGEPKVDVDSIPGIATAAIDWKERIKGMKPEMDPLASAIPADQHAIFFHDFNSLMTLADEADRDGTPVLQFAEQRSEDAGTRYRYERQLGLSLTGLGRLLGPRLVKSVAITGSDPYLRSGSDLVILFEPKEADALKTLLTAQLAAARQSTPQAKEVEGKSGSLQYAGVRSPDRALCSYLAVLNNGNVVITNSEAQLTRLAAVQDGKADPLSKSPEYTFFRDRYKLGDESESALVVLTDATIRRWCSARWRIGDSRRTRAAAVLADLEAGSLDALVSGKVEPGPVHGEFPVPGLDDVRLTPQGASSLNYGRLGFLTPISELNLDSVTQGEADAYKRWKDSYETNWRGVFDPIAVRLGVSQKKLSADVTVMPLIAGSDYRPMMEITRGAKLKDPSGDPHECLARAGLAINIDSPQIKEASAFAVTNVPNLKIDPLGWVGQCIWCYADDDPFWAEWAGAERPEEFIKANFGRLPFAVRVEVSNGFKLTAFLVAVHSFIEQSAPGMTAWQTLTYKDQSYVKISPTEQAIGQEKELKDAALYYRATGDALLITLNEPMLKRAIDRQVERDAAVKAGKPLPAPAQPLLGESFAMQTDLKGYGAFVHLANDQYQTFMQQRSWSNLPILNELKQRYPDQDPLTIYERLFHAKLLDPAAGQYVWSEKWQTMESTVYGCPAEPKKGPADIAALKGLLRANLGITFQNDGLRARGEIER